MSVFDTLKNEICDCKKCPLGFTRINPVVGVGNTSSKVVFVGEGPGFMEDHAGEPFVGRSGQLLDKILESIGLSRQTVYITNIVKCHPMKDPSNPELKGNDRPPTAEEIKECLPYLHLQLMHIQPHVIVTLGSVATKAFLGEDVFISKVRGVPHPYCIFDKQLTILPTYHPAALLRNPTLKRDVWTDMKLLRDLLK